MTLKAYLSAQGLTYKAFASSIGVTTTAAWRYASGMRHPKPAIMRRIMDATGGEVGPTDFLDQGPEGEAA